MILSPAELERITGVIGAGKAQVTFWRKDFRKSVRVGMAGRATLCRQVGETRVAREIRIREVSADGASWLSAKEAAPQIGESIMVGLEPRGDAAGGVSNHGTMWITCEVMRRQSVAEGRVIVGVCFIAKAKTPDLKKYVMEKEGKVSVGRVFSPRTGATEQPAETSAPKKKRAKDVAVAARTAASSSGRVRKSDEAELERLKKAVLG